MRGKKIGLVNTIGQLDRKTPPFILKAVLALCGSRLRVFIPNEHGGVLSSVTPSSHGILRSKLLLAIRKD